MNLKDKNGADELAQPFHCLAHSAPAFTAWWIDTETLSDNDRWYNVAETAT